MPFMRRIFTDVIRTYFFEGPDSLAELYEDYFPVGNKSNNEEVRMIPKAMLALVTTGVSQFHGTTRLR